ncbi:hypothetical protein BB560_005439 [Smittium megazygosporum]|uniref:Uncharacterized protein n=1 Tax=Smittium megazygosporum TaxID=133381 RepID=A0A2T9Z5E0_9FUNG|nr:hypothetical protein BB560_005439 [Smittium megazygosporum]
MVSNNKTVIVTGASKGIGRAACVQLIKANANVVGIARSEPDLESLVQECKEIDGTGRFVYVVGDVTEQGTCKALVDKAVSEFGGIDGLVNNAATLFPLGVLSTLPKEQVRKHFDINLVSILQLTQLALPYLRKSKGRVVNISSGSAVRPMYSSGLYTTSKYALNMLTANMALEEPDIAFIALRPGVVDTDMHTFAREKGMNYLTPEDYALFVSLKTESKLLPPSVPGKVICNLALYLDNSLSGQFLGLDSEELAPYKD